MKLSEIKTVLRTAIGRGNSYDDALTVQIKLAVQEIEGRRDWQYARKSKATTLAENESVVTAPTNMRNLRQIRLAMTTDAGGTEWLTVKRKREEDVVVTGASGMPSCYWLEGEDRLVFDTVADKDYLLRIMYFEWTDVADNDNFTCTLFKRGANLLIGTVLMKMGSLIRNSEVANVYIANVQMAESALVEWDDSLTYDGRDLEAS